MVRYLSTMLTILLFITGVTAVAHAQSGEISGVVVDAATGDPLPGANVYLAGTAIGTASDIKGHYHIQRVPPGSYTLKATFIGYQQFEIPVQIGHAEKKKIDLKLAFDIVEGETVVITAQAEGQVAAINQQLRSNTIKNVVSAERIMELPDANAAESVGRLPGISIIRSGGEGNRIVIRGLAPTYNLITINGEKVPATDLEDRSVDLNMISPEMLAGIEVTKALTPDQDADAFGGTVNFKLADAPDGGFRYNFRFQEGYNNQRTEFGQYKGSLTLSNRFWNNRLGIMVTGSMEKAQRGADQFQAGYSLTREKREGEAFAPVAVTLLSLDYVDEIRERAGFSVIMDYRYAHGKLMFSNFMSRLDRHEMINRNRYTEESNWHELRYRDRQRQIDVLTNSLAGEHNLGIGELDWRVSRTASLTRHPYDNYIRFQERSAFNQSLLTSESYGPETLIEAAYHNYDNMGIYTGNFTTEKSFERDYSSQLNFKIPFTFSSKLSGYLKMGGKYVNKIKNRDKNYWHHRLDSTDPKVERYHTRYGTPGFEFDKLVTGWPAVSNYIDENFDPGNYLNGMYEFGPGLDGDELNHLLKAYLLDSLYEVSPAEDLKDYETKEEVSAGYLMTEINVGQYLMFMPGARYEYTSADMTGRKGWIGSDSEPSLDDPTVTDTSATNTYGRWFPMMHVRIKPTRWFDIRLAYTETLSRPRLDYMLPLRRVDGSAQTVEFGRPDLKPQISINYDIFLSFYNNNLGLLTCGGFAKEISNLIFKREGHKILRAIEEGYTPDLQGLLLDQPENSNYLTNVKGWEIEWQTRLHWLPGFLNGIVLNANYTHIWSTTQYPRSFVHQKKLNVFPFVETTVIDTFRTGDMIDQPDDIANIAIGYDKGPLSARLSMLYQGKTLAVVGERPELDSFTADLIRWDLSVKYSLTKHIGLFFYWNNITNQVDESYQMKSSNITNQEYYGWTMDVGLGYAF